MTTDLHSSFFPNEYISCSQIPGGQEFLVGWPNCQIGQIARLPDCQIDKLTNCQIARLADWPTKGQHLIEYAQYEDR